MSDSFRLLDAARECPERVALVAEGRPITFGELALQVDAARAAIADLLGERGTKNGPVALRATPRPETLVAVYALLELGIPLVPVHPRLTSTEARIVVEEAGAAVSLEDADLAALGARPARPILATGTGNSLDDAPLAILFTSGTTGRPRGAMLTRDAFAASAAASEKNLPWRQDDRWLLCMPVSHVGGLSVLTRCLRARRAVVLHPRFDPGAVLASIAGEGVTRISVVPTMLHDLLERDIHNDLAALDTVLVGGAATPSTLLEACAARGVRALTTYGLTEACSQVTTQTPRDPRVLERGSGRPLHSIEVRTVDDDGRPCARGDVGRILVRGPTLMRGYLGHAPLDGELDTGDLGSLDERGHLHVASRRVDLIVTGGENVYPAEVEAALTACTGVREAVVFGVANDRWGQEVAAVLVPTGPTLEEARIREELSTKLASFKMPRRVCVTEALPKGASGKVSRTESARRFEPALRRW